MQVTQQMSLGEFIERLLRGEWGSMGRDAGRVLNQLVPPQHRTVQITVSFSNSRGTAPWSFGRCAQWQVVGYRLPNYSKRTVTIRSNGNGFVVTVSFLP